MSIATALKRVQGDIRAAKTLAADTESRRILTRDFASYPFLRAVSLSGKPAERTVHLVGNVALTYRAARGDIWALRQMWVDEVCRLPVAISPAVIVDLGANIGMAGVFLAKRYGCSRLIAVEPVSGNVVLARRNYAQNEIDAFVFEGVVGDKAGTARFLNSVDSGNGRVDFANSKTNDNSETLVPMITIDTLLADVPITETILMKMDIEGAEQPILQNRPEWLQRVSALLLEFHPPLANEKQLTEIVLASGFISHPANSELTTFFLHENLRRREQSRP